MILDRLENSSVYARLDRRFAAGFAYLQETDLAKLPDGRYGIDGADVVAVVQAYTTKPRSEGRWEAHRRHADIQYVVSGVERMGVTPIRGMRLQPPYDPEKDFEFYTGEGGQFFSVGAGEFAVFFPHDVHMPSLSIERPEVVKKVVVKVRLA